MYRYVVVDAETSFIYMQRASYPYTSHAPKPIPGVDIQGSFDPLHQVS